MPYDDDLENCPRCNEDMWAWEKLCKRCQQQEDIDNMTERDYRAMEAHTPSWSGSKVGIGHSSFAVSGIVEIHWNVSSPELPVSFKPFATTIKPAQPLNEAQLKYDDCEYHDSPFKGEQFNGWDSSDVAKYINNWFSEIK